MNFKPSLTRGSGATHKPGTSKWPKSWTKALRELLPMSNFKFPATEWKTDHSFYYRFLFSMGNPTFY